MASPTPRSPGSPRPSGTRAKARAGRIAIVGRPNVGKSTLLNALVGERIAITSHHPQTTRDRIQGVVTQGKTQYVLVDTPGVAVHGLITAATRDRVQPIEVIAEAVYRLASGDPATLTGRVAYAEPLLEELGLAPSALI